MGVKVLVAVGLVFFSQVGLALSQIDIIPEGLGNLLQLPILAAFIWLTISFLKWHHEQMKMLLETYEQRLNKMSDRIELLTQQLAMNTGTVNESLRTGELIDEVKLLLVKALPQKEGLND